MTHADDRLQKEVLRLGRLSEREKNGQFEGNNRQLRVLARIGAGKLEDLITQTYIGDHEEMKLAVDNLAVVLQGLQMKMAQLTEASLEWPLGPKGRDDEFRPAIPRSGWSPPEPVSASLASAE
jgi:hypothetical protein